MLVLCALLFASCSSDEEAKDNRTTVTGHAEAILAEDLPPEQTLSALNNLWLEIDTSPELAKCYSDLFESEGLAEGIDTIEDLMAVQAEMTDEQLQAFGDCGPNTK